MAETWDESKPAGSRSPALGDDDIREFKRAERERMAEDHIREAVENPPFGAPGGYKIGKHKYVTLVAQATAKTTASDEVTLRAEDIGGGAIELVLTPKSAGTDRQLTKNSGANFNLLSGDIADGFVSTAMLADLAVTTGKINDLAVTTEKLAALGVTSEKIANYAVGSNQLNTGAVSTDKIVDLAVTMAKIQTEIAGDNNYAALGRLSGTPFGLSVYTSYQTGLTIRFAFPGILRFYTGSYRANDTQYGNFRILKNGVVHLSWSLGSSGWAYRTDDIAVVAGDYLNFQYQAYAGIGTNMSTQMRGQYLNAIFNYIEPTITP